MKLATNVFGLMASTEFSQQKPFFINYGSLTDSKRMQTLTGNIGSFNGKYLSSFA